MFHRKLRKGEVYTLTIMVTTLTIYIRNIFTMQIIRIKFKNCLQISIRYIFEKYTLLHLDEIITN